MSIIYNHSQNLHTLVGPQAAMEHFFADNKPSSLLDVGCGNGTWLKAATDFGISDVLGVDGVNLPTDKLHISPEKIRHQDLTKSWDLGKKFDVAICLEVAEHLDGEHAPKLVESLVRHSDKIYFSAACPGQEGQHHVNCQWPTYWQELFNERGFVCEDSLRWQIWNIPAIEPWYRQNIFIARRDTASAGREPRINAVLHPEMTAPVLPEKKQLEKYLKLIENGHLSLTWYLKTPGVAFFKKLKRHLP